MIMTDPIADMLTRIQCFATKACLCQYASEQ